MLPGTTTVCAASPPPQLVGPAWLTEGGYGRARQATRALFFPRRASTPVMKPSAWPGRPAQGSLEQTAEDQSPASPHSQRAPGGQEGTRRQAQPTCPPEAAAWESAGLPGTACVSSRRPLKEDCPPSHFQVRTGRLQRPRGKSRTDHQDGPTPPTASREARSLAVTF